MKVASRVLATMLCPSDFTVCLSVEGTVYSFGGQRAGELGFEGTKVFPPKRIPSLTNITCISCGFENTTCLDDAGNVFTLGGNKYGQLGVGKNSEELAFTSTPLKLELPSIKQISSGYRFVICLSYEGVLYSFGHNMYGQLGNSGYENSVYPTTIDTMRGKDIDFVECGGVFVICKLLNNEIYAWGDNSEGTLGIGRKISSISTPEKCEDWPDDVVDIKCSSHTLVLTSVGEVYSCGGNEHGELGRDLSPEEEFSRDNDNDYYDPGLPYSGKLQIIESLSEIIRIECGHECSLCIDVNNNLYAFGNNNCGQLGFGDYENRATPEKNPDLSDIIDISSLGDYTFAKTSSNMIFAFGKNDDSQLGIKTENKNQLYPIQVLQDNEEIWHSNVYRSKAKSARF